MATRKHITRKRLGWAVTPLRLTRMLRQMGLREVSNLSGVNLRYLSEAERGIRELDAERKRAVAVALDAPMRTLFH